MEAQFLPYLNLVSLETTQFHKHSLPQNFHSKFTQHVTSCSTFLTFFLPILLLFTLVFSINNGTPRGTPWRPAQGDHVSRASQQQELSI